MEHGRRREVAAGEAVVVPVPERRWHEVALDAAEVGTFDWDLDSGLIRCDHRYAALFSLPGDGPPRRAEDFLRRIHPDDVTLAEEAITAALHPGGRYESEFRVSLDSGDVRWVLVRGRALTDDDGVPHRLVGTGVDVSALRTAKDAAAQVLEGMALGYYSVDERWRLTYLNAEGERILGCRREDVLGLPVWEAFPGAEELEYGGRYELAMDSGTQQEFEEYYAHLDAWMSVRIVPKDRGLAVYFVDITERHEIQERTERATERAELLSHVSASVAATLDPLAMVAELPRLVAPSLADWCIVTVREDDGRLRDLGWWHGDERARDLVGRYAHARGEALRRSRYVEEVLRTGRPITLDGGATEALLEVVGEGEAGEVLAALAPTQVALLPLRAHGRTTGLLNVFAGPGRDVLEATNFATIVEVAHRAGVALDNARLYRQQRGIAEGLQRGLLTPPPQIEELDVAVRYQPAAQAAQVGGDWYDSFFQADGRTVLVIGDVVGHDTEAAAAMAQVRALLRGIGYVTGGSPAQILSGLDDTMGALRVDTTATAVVARVEQTQDERERATARLRWSNAGHPPPLVAYPDGRVEVLAAAQPGLLLGIKPDVVREDLVVELPQGSTVLLYTDGLVERREQVLDEGIGLLREALAELVRLPLEELCDRLLERLLPHSREDDVALVAVRLSGIGPTPPADPGPTATDHGQVPD